MKNNRTSPKKSTKIPKKEEGKNIVVALNKKVKKRKRSAKRGK